MITELEQQLERGKGVNKQKVDFTEKKILSNKRKYCKVGSITWYFLFFPFSFRSTVTVV